MSHETYIDEIIINNDTTLNLLYYLSTNSQLFKLF